MPKIEREDIHIIARHSNWSEKSIATTLKQEIYNKKESWHEFLSLFFISLGVCFTTAGIMFFFAYNWADLHKFIKIGLIEGLIIGVTLVVLFAKINENIKNILLTGSSILVGVLFAVFGQIYQTGANAYDFFLGWTLSILLWVLVSNFAPLWLIFIALLNTTIVLYAEQVAYDWPEGLLITLLFIINLMFFFIGLFGKKFIKEIHPPIWFINTIALVTVSLSTIGICNGILDEHKVPFYILIVITLILYSLGIKYGLKVKSGFYLSIIPFSIIIIITALLMNLSNDAEMFFVISIFVIASVTFVIKTLINLQKEWMK